MLEHVFRRSRLRQRIRNNPIGPVLERYVAYLVARGHRLAVVHQYVLAAEHFGRWVGRRRINQHRVRQFIRRHLPVCRCSTPAIRNLNCVRAALNRLLEMVSTGAVTSLVRQSFVEKLLSQYAHHLECVQGLAAQTISYRLRYARRLLRRGRIYRASHLAKFSSSHFVLWRASDVRH